MSTTGSRALPRLAASGGSGALLVLAFPPVGWWWCAPLAVAGLTLTLWRVGVRRGSWLGLAFGTTFFVGLMPWLRVIGPDAWLLLAVFCAGYLAAMGMALALVTRLPGWPLWVACTWVLQELVRARIPFGGYPWGRLAFSQATSPFTPLASLGGTAVVAFAVALVGALLAAAVLRIRRQRIDRGVVGLIGAALALTLLGLAVPLPTAGQQVTVAVVQGNVPRTGMDAFAQREAVLRNHVQASEQLAANVAVGRQAQPDLVVWPENSSDIDPFSDPAAYDLIDSAVRSLAAPTLVGLVVPAPDGRRLENLGVVWDPVSGPGQTYVKRHPVPFGEYVPFRRWLTPVISRFKRVPEDFVAGKEPGVLELGPATIGDVICFEVAYDDVVRDVVRDGADLLAVQTNNATYGRTGQVEQQLAMAQLRAVEHGRSVLVAATSGISAIISPDGSVLAEAPEFTQTSLVQQVPLRSGLTLADRVGAVPEWLFALLGTGALAIATWRARRTSHSGDDTDDLPSPTRAVETSAGSPDVGGAQP